jgi:hypothetical protein
VQSKRKWVIFSAAVMAAVTGIVGIMAREHSSGQAARAVSPVTEAPAVAPLSRPTPRDETPELFPSSQKMIQLAGGGSRVAFLTETAAADGHRNATLWMVGWPKGKPNVAEIFTGADAEDIASPLWIRYDTGAESHRAGTGGSHERRLWVKV